MYLSREEREYNAAKTFLQQDWDAYRGTLSLLGLETTQTQTQPCASVKVDPQSQSTLFSRIPVEVRELIWQHLFNDLSEHTFGTTSSGGSSSSSCCGGGGGNDGNDGNDVNRPAKILTQGQICLWLARKGNLRKCTSCNRYKDVSPSASGPQMLAVVLSCRLAYLETLNFLYSVPALKLNRAAFVLKLPTLLSPPQFHSIRSLALSWTVMSYDASPANRKTDQSITWTAGLRFADVASVEQGRSRARDFITNEWFETWRAISSMQGLHHLIVSYHIEYSLFRIAWLDTRPYESPRHDNQTMALPRSRDRQESEVFFWDAVRQVKAPQDFRLYIDGWIVMFHRLQAWTLPCQTRFHNFHYSD